MIIENNKEIKMNNNFFPRLKRFIIATFTIFLFISYFILTDPNTDYLSNLHYGTALIITLQIFIIAALGIWIVEVNPDFFLDAVFGKEKKLVEQAKNSATGAGLALLAKSIRILGYSIIVAGSIIAFTSN
jgi:hypothetical protein